MKIAIGSDHGGFELKQALIPFLQGRDIEVADAGTYTTDSVDYPEFAEAVALLVVHGEADAGIVICGTGIGMSAALLGKLGNLAVTDAALKTQATGQIALFDSRLRNSVQYTTPTFNNFSGSALYSTGENGVGPRA